MTRKENQEKEQENKMVIIIERKTGGKMRAKEGDRVKSLERLAPIPPLLFLCGARLCPHLHPALVTSNSHCLDIYLPACALIQGHTGQGKEGGRKERGKKEGGFLQPRKLNSESGGGGHRKKWGRRLRLIDL